MQDKDGRTQRLIYCTAHDISRPNGPGVNERQFITSLYALLGDRAVFVLPRPSLPLPASFPGRACHFFSPGLSRELGLFLALRRAWRARPGSLMVLRAGNSPLPLAPALFFLLFRPRLVIKTVDAYFTHSFPGKHSRFSCWFLRRRLLAFLLRRAEGLDTVSAFFRDKLAELYGKDLPGRLRIVDNGVDLSLFRPLDKAGMRRELGLSGFSQLIGYAGARAWDWGGAAALKALDLLVKDFSGLGLLILSNDGRDIDRLRAEAESLGLGRRLVLAGPVPLDRVPGYLNALDLALSLRPDEACAELKLRQAIACGRPVLFRNPVNAFVVEHDLGSRVEGDDPAELAAAAAGWLRRLADPGSAELIAQRLAAYAAEHLDINRMNRFRLDFWGLEEKAC